MVDQCQRRCVAMGGGCAWCAGRAENPLCILPCMGLAASAGHKRSGAFGKVCTPAWCNPAPLASAGVLQSPWTEAISSNTWAYLIAE